MSANICRCCAELNPKEKKLYHIAEQLPRGKKATTMCKIFQGLQFSLKDDLSPYICSICVEKLEIAHSFYTLCKLSQEKLQLDAMIQNQQAKNLKPILPKPINQENSFKYSESFKCLRCSLTYSTRQSLEEHMTSFHKPSSKSKRTFTCPECNQHFTSKRLMIYHRKEHFGMQICYCCHTIFLTLDQLKEHLEKVHKNQEIFLCSRCNQRFKSRKFLFEHTIRLHKVRDMVYRCSECSPPRSFEGISVVIEHVNLVHRRSTSDTDTKGAEIQSGESPSKEHSDNAHSGNEDLEMYEEFLDEFFLNETNGSPLVFPESWDTNEFFKELHSDTQSDDFLKNIESTTETLEFDIVSTQPVITNIILMPCTLCNEKFSSQKDLIFHLAQCHNKTTGIFCSVCGKHFNSIYEMEEHKRAHIEEKYKIDTSDMKIEVRKDGTIFKCNLCHRIFKEQQHYARHKCLRDLQNDCKFICSNCGLKFLTMLRMNEHTCFGDNSHPVNFECCECSKTFTTGAALKKHVTSVHENIKPYECSLCDRFFVTLDHLKKHVNSFHQKERNFLCTECGKKFSQSRHLKEHILTHRGIKRHVCELCGKQYVRLVDKQNHVNRVHETKDTESRQQQSSPV